MKGKVLLTILGAMAAVLPVSAAEYKPLLEEGKSWIVGQALSKKNNLLSPVASMAEYVVLLECRVEDAVEIEGEQCRYVTVRTLGSDQLRFSQPFLEKDGVLSIYDRYKNHPDAWQFSPVLDFNCQVGDSVLVYPRYYEHYQIEPTSSDYYFPTDVRSVTGSDSKEYREIIFADKQDSWVEGVGSTTSRIWLCPLAGYVSIAGCKEYFMIECRKDGKTIFRNENFAYPNSCGLQNVNTLTPGKSWTMARGNAEFTVAVDRDTLVNDINCIVLKSSEGKEYVVAEENGRVYAFFDHLGPADPRGNAMLLGDTNPYSPIIKRTDGVTGEVTDWDYSMGEEHWWKGEIRELNVGGRIFKEHLVTNAEAGGDVVASWVEGVGAPDAQSWATQMPEGYDLRMIDCRQDGEVIFTAEDFGYQSGIAEVRADSAKRSGVYDLQGRRVATPGRGLYIIDGKKQLIR